MGNIPKMSHPASRRDAVQCFSVEEKKKKHFNLRFSLPGWFTGLEGSAGGESRDDGGEGLV